MSAREKITRNGSWFERLSENAKSAILFSAVFALICLVALLLGQAG
jgi:hypothetical protein